MITLAVTIGMIFLGMQYGPQAAYFTELFSTRCLLGRFIGLSDRCDFRWRLGAHHCGAVME